MDSRRTFGCPPYLPTRLFATLVLTLTVAALTAFAELKKDVEYGRAGAGRLLLDVSIPDGPGPFPIAILVHGGGWRRGDKGGSDIPGDGADISPWFAPLSAAKFTWFSINYRFIPANPWPAGFEDLQTAIRWVKAHATEFKSDPSRIALFGHSAGGHLVALAATNAMEDTRVQAIVGFAPVTDFDPTKPRNDSLAPSHLLDRPKDVAPALLAIMRDPAPVNHVNARMPPVLIVQGDADKTVPFQRSLDFQAKVRAAGVTCDIITIKGGPHSIVLGEKIDPAWKTEMVAWLRGAFDAVHAANLIRPDLVVAADGDGDFRTVQAALNSIPRGSRERRIVFIKEGIYREKIRIDAACVTLRGQSRRGTRIEFAQGRDDFTQKPDDIGVAVVNINADDCVLENLSVENTHGVIGKHAFAITGRGDRTVITDCDVFSDGNDTLALWNGKGGRYYNARLNVRGSVDFVCPEGWCYMTGSTLFEVNPHAGAALWHDGSKNKDQKFVLRDCRFDGAEGWRLVRHHYDAQFFLLDCRFSKSMGARAPYRVRYPTDGSAPSLADHLRNARLDAKNVWGERTYFDNSHHVGGDYAWHADNLANAAGAPAPVQITAKWTFGGTWDPERRDGPAVTRVERRGDLIAVHFAEAVTVKGKPELTLSSGKQAPYASGSGTDTVMFKAPAGDAGAGVALDFKSGAIVACEASAALRVAAAALPAAR